REARVWRISLSAHNVSPTNTALGSVTSVHARLAAAFSLVSGTVIPVISARVKVLFTSGRRNRVRSAYGTLKWIWFVFIVRQVNPPLSPPLIGRPILLWNPSPTWMSSKTRPRHDFGAPCSSLIARHLPLPPRSAGHAVPQERRPSRRRAPPPLG